MAKYTFAKEVLALPHEQQKAIQNVLIKTGLLNSAGESTDLSVDKMSEKHKEALQTSLSSLGVEHDLSMPSINWKCAAARVAEAAAVAACASVPGGQIAIAACIAAAHELANKACE